MRARTVNFERGQDPKNAMGIGMGKEALHSRIKQLMGSADEDEVYDYISDLAMKKGGAFEMYLDQANEFEELYWLSKILGKGKIKVKGVHVDDHYKDSDMDDQTALDRGFRKQIQPLLDKGWNIWHEEENYDFREYILIKYPVSS